MLFLCVDDLRPELGCYGAEGMLTPNIDALAERGVRFTRAYCQQATCGPSRASLLTGCRPKTTGVLTLYEDYRERLPDLVVLPELFKQNGWYTRALGKVHHGDGRVDDARAWSETCWRPEHWQSYYALPESQAAVAAARARIRTRFDGYPRVLAWEAPDVPATELGDGQIADEAIRFLEQRGDEPFFLALGFLKPHLPFVAPKRFWDLYPEDEIDLDALPPWPAGAPGCASNSSAEVMAYENIPNDVPISPEQQLTLRRGYSACVSHVDAQIGRVLAALEEEGIAERTIVVLWGDHGWHLGDLGLWGKHTNFEAATRTPLIVYLPGMVTGGAACASLVESVDIYPTLAELCGLTAPERIEGVSFVPLLDDPQQPWKSAVFSRYPRRVPGVGKTVGRSMRTERHRVVEWTLKGKDFREVEVYDLAESTTETINLATDEANAELVEGLIDQLHAGWRKALPPLASESVGD